RMALGVEQDTIRGGAADVLVQIFLSGTVKTEELFPALHRFFESRNQTLRRGVLECYVKMGTRLPEDESRNVIALLKRVDMGADCSYLEDEELLLEIPIFLDYWPSRDSMDFLLTIARNNTCLRPRIKAVENLPKVAKLLPTTERSAIKDALQNLVGTDIPSSLTASIKIASKQIEAMQGP